MTDPFPDIAYLRRPSSRRSSSRASTAVTASTVVSTYASPIAPLSLETRICVASTRAPPPNTYGAEKEPRALMKTSSIAPASDGVSSGSVMRRRSSARVAPRPRAASSSVVS